jgi:hypothetical protein
MITARRILAILSTCIRLGIAILVSIVALLDTGAHKTVATRGVLAGALRSVRTGISHAVVAVVALFARVDDAVAAGCWVAALSACVRHCIAIVSAVVALFLVLWINDIVTAEWVAAIRSARCVRLVAVLGPVVAFLFGGRVEVSISAD